MEKMACFFNPRFDLKDDTACCQIPVMKVTAVTGRTGFKFRPATDGEYLHADEYGSKPIPVADLLSRV